MYKTVRKGDASLQYTIVPQTDQFTSSGFPQTSSKSSPRIIKYTMGTLVVLIFLFCVATPFLMNQNDQSLFASTMLAMGRVGHSTTARNSSRSQGKDISVNKNKSRPSVTTTMSSTEAYRKQDVEDEITTLLEVLNRTDEQETEDFTTTDSTVSSTQRLQTSTDASTNIRQLFTSTMFPSTLPSTSSTSLKTFTDTPSEATKTSSSPPATKAKMPKVTLKLRENETIPQMYMKAGIASYKKGNITTSVLAHDLSLEGLIFKTPEGTIKPWPQKWFFTDSSSDFQWKLQSDQGLNSMGMRIYIVVAALASLVAIGLTLMLHIKYCKAIRRQRQSVEEPEVEGHEEDKSTLLGAESQENE